MQKLKRPIAVLLLSWMLLSVCILGAAATPDEPAALQTESSATESQPVSEPSGETVSEPTSEPASTLSTDPTGESSSEPSGEPTGEPSSEPSSDPTGEPSSEPSSEPSNDPSSEPSSEPVSEPTSEPSTEPSNDPETLSVNPQVSITADNVEVELKKTIGLHAEAQGFAQTPTLTWKSDDSSVATVDDNGRVTGKKIGRTAITVTAKDGTSEAHDSMVIYVTKDRNAIQHLIEHKQVLGYKYSFRDDYYYTNDKNCWQSDYGFAKFYDLVAPYMLLEYDYVRVYFTYEGKDWMIQLWKGQYGLLFYGAEQGVYTKSHSDKAPNIFTMYNCAGKGDWLDMEMTLYHDKSGNGNYVRELSRDYGKYWWCTGFKEGHLRRQEPASELRTVGTITLKDAEMTRLFTEGLKELGFKEATNKDNIGLDAFYTDGNSVHFVWQNINDAETTMPIKYASAAAIGGFGAVLAFFIGIFAFMAVAFAGLGLLIIIL